MVYACGQSTDLLACDSEATAVNQVVLEQVLQQRGRPSHLQVQCSSLETQQTRNAHSQARSAKCFLQALMALGCAAVSSSCE